MATGPVHPTQAAARSNIFNWIFFVLAFAAWIIALAGLAQTQDADGSRSGRDSVVFYSLYWWIIFYEFFLLILSILLIVERPVRLLAYRKPIGDNFIIITALLSYFAYQFCVLSRFNEPDQFPYARGVKCTAAGVVMLLILNYIWIIVSGSGMNGPRALPQATPSYTGGAPGAHGGPGAAYQSPSPVSSPPKGLDVEKGSPVQPQVYVISDANPAANGAHRV